jgi:peptidoglycan/xylan/chitin deacetylase (PgdA/CDA1 family)
METNMEYKYKESSKLRNTKQIAKLANYSGFLNTYSYIKRDNNIVVIAYHRVGPYEDKSPLKVSISEFEKQCKHFMKSYKIISLSELIQSILEKRPLKKMAVITFDDGYKDNYIHAFPILKRYKIPATIFLASGHIGTDNLFWWDKIDYVLRNTKLKDIEIENFGKISLNKYENRWQKIFEFKAKLKQISEENKNKIIDEIVKLSDVDISDIGKETILSWDDVKYMNEFGIDFGSHTVTHPILKKISLSDVKYEVTFSKKTIESKLGHPIDSFSYPNGTIDDFDDQVSSIVKDAGFKCAVTGIQRMVTTKSDLYKLERLNSADNFNLFKFYISGLYTDINRVLR